MASLSRRALLKATTGLAATMGLRARAHEAPSRSLLVPRRPRALVQFFLVGGMDALLTTDPKLSSEVTPKIEVPYSETDIVAAGGQRVGPLLAPWREQLPRMAILNGVLCSTVAHKNGELQIGQMRRVFPAGSHVGLTGTLGAHFARDYPLDDFRFVGGIMSPPHLMLPDTRSLVVRSDSPFTDAGILARLSELARQESHRGAVKRVLSSELGRCAPSQACMPFEVLAGLLERMPRAPFPPMPEVAADSRRSEPEEYMLRLFLAILRDTLFLLEHQLTPAVFIATPMEWDSHAYNLEAQKRSTALFLTGFRYFLEQLELRSTPDGVPLSAQVGLLLSSELGRFPILNAYQGKDHLPEFPAILMGPGIRPGTYGQTDARMCSVPIDVRTGRPGADPRHSVVPSIDDLGATLLHWFGIEDTLSRGYTGRRLDFLLA